MPDWSYRTVLRPLMLALGAERSRRLAVSTLRRLRSPLGGRAIDFLGHMAPDERLRTQVAGLELAGPIVLGSMIDPAGEAIPSFARFGVGMIEVGPVAETSVDADPGWRVDVGARHIDVERPIVVSTSQVLENLERAGGVVPVCVRIAKQDAAAVGRIVTQLRPYATMFVVDPDNVLDALGDRPLLTDDEPHEKAAGVWTRGDADQVRAIRARVPADAVVVAAGALDPHGARAALDAGATLVAIDTGLVLSGPGLIKRCNEALLSSKVPRTDPEAISIDAARRAWTWALVMGVAMFLGGVLALLIGSTRVVLPYDESMCGLTRNQIADLNPRLLPFMAHDRVSLAGTMLSIGIFYVALALGGIRRGAHWAQVAVIASAFFGFLSFFSFLGFGYFDPFHAFVTAVLLQFMLLCLVLQPSPRQPPVAEWRETAAWRRGQWGQLLFIFMGIGLTVAGIVMTVIGCTRVFVNSDLEFMRTTAAELLLSYDRLVPLVAHDRASLGGMLVANGVAVWLSAQWGFRAGERWLWRALAWGGNIAFACTVVVHIVVGYRDPLHLAPAIGGWVIWNVALVLTKEWLTQTASALWEQPAADTMPT